MLTRAVYLDVRGEAMAGLLTPPQGGSSGIAVLLVPPFGWDDQSSYRPRRDWAQALAAAGHAALRIDLPGTGDSEGSVHDGDRVASWIAGIGVAAQWLRGLGYPRVVAAAMGLGGLLTLAAVRDGLELDAAVLWGLPETGRHVVRELKAFGRLEVTQTGEDPADIPEGELRAGGHVLPAAAAKSISALKAAELGVPPRVLLLGRDGTGPDESLVNALNADSDPGRGWGAAVAGPQESRPAGEVYATVNAWLEPLRPETVPHVREPDAPASAEIEIDGVVVRETPLWWDDGPGRLFGVLCEPLEEAIGSAIFTNAGAIRHIGPSRMWTEVSRRWAARGVAVLRMDAEGIGESDGEAARYVDGEALHQSQLPLEVTRALDVLAARGLPQRFLLGGMCSGAFWAFQTALADARVAGVVSLNQRMFFFDPDAEPNRELRRFIRIFTPTGFRYMLMGDRRLLRLWRLVKWVAKLPLRRIGQRRNPPAPGDPLVDALQLLRDRGQRLDLAFSLEEPLHDDLVAADRLRDLEPLGVRLHELPHISHTLKPVAAQRAAMAVLDQVAERTFPAPVKARAQ